MTRCPPRPAVSVIVPVFNAETTLDETVRSVLEQSLPDWELLLIDDGSTDESGAACDRYALRDGRIRAFHTENRGYGRARNMGLEHAAGEWIAFLDSDDCLAPRALETMLGHSAGAGAVMALHQTVPRPSVPESGAPGGLFEYPGDMAEVFRSLYEPYFLLSVCGKIYRRELMSGGFDTREGDLMSDWLFNFRVMPAARRIRFLPETVYYYRWEGGVSHSVRFHSEWLYAAKRVCRTVLELFPGRPDIEAFMAERYTARAGQYLAFIASLSGVSGPEKQAMIGAERSDSFYDQPAVRHAVCGQRYAAVWEAFMADRPEEALEAARRALREMTM